MGSVAESLKDVAPVVTNDAMSFTAALSRARFTAVSRSASSANVAERLVSAYKEALQRLEADFHAELSGEAAALAGSRADLTLYMERALHVGNSAPHRRAARTAAESSGAGHYRLATLYFSAGYLSFRQAVELDALRAAIDADRCLGDRDWLLGAWIAATSVLINAPGHTAQFLRPNSASAHSRIVRTWARSMWDEFVEALETVALVGSVEWRCRNSVYVGDALDLISAGQLRDIGTVYADPPYTRDQYSRYYHVYETLYRYDYPNSSGAGRNRSDRFTTGFSLKSAVVASFHDLCRNVARMGVPLVISYPSAGLLQEAGFTVDGIASLYFDNITILSFEANHSTMGASSGKSKKSATENLYVCTL
jgi:adenine-specific DNA-methyltransferase